MYDNRRVVRVKKKGTIVMICPKCDQRGSLQLIKQKSGDPIYLVDHGGAGKKQNVCYISKRKMPEEYQKAKRLATLALIRLS